MEWHRTYEMVVSYVMFQHSPPLVQPLVMMTYIYQEGRSPLYVARFRGHCEVVNILLKSNADVNQGNMVGTHFYSVTVTDL